MPWRRFEELLDSDIYDGFLRLAYDISGNRLPKTAGRPEDSQSGAEYSGPHRLLERELMKRKCLWILSVLSLFAAILIPVSAQTTGGTIAGTVLDPSGALVPNATVVAVGAETGTTYKTVSTSSGDFHFPQMQLGPYNVTVSAAGFSQVQLNGIVVTTGNVSPAVAHLALGNESETVTVNDNAPMVETENSEVSNTISSKQIVDLPLSLGGQSAFRSVETFIFLAPGTVGPGTAGSTSGAFQAKTAGGQNFGTEELLDGISVRREDSNSAFDEHAPSVEALTELKVTTSIIPASEGRTTGGVENFSTKGGTNKFHGTAYDFFQNEDLNANTYFNKLRIAQNPGDAGVFASNQRPLDKKNDYGGAVGGPLSIPHLYNGHDRTFGFFEFEQFRQSQGGIAVSSIPTAAVRGGDFSSQLTNKPDGSLVDCNGNQVFVGEILDPATTSTRNGVLCRLPFPGNKIDPSRFSAVAQNVLKFLPLPNTGGPGQTTQNYTYATNFPRLNTTYTIRIDHSLSEKSKIFATYTDRDNDITNGNPPYPGPGGAVQVQSAFAKYLRVGNDYTFTPSSFNHFIVGFNRLYQFNRGNSVGFTPDFDKLLGIGGASGPAFPSISFSSTAVPSYNSLGYNNDSIQPVNLFEVSDTFTKILGRHTFSVGLDFRKDQFTNEDKGANSGSFQFAQFQTAAGPSDTQSGDGFASLLLGRVNSGGLGIQSRAPRIGQDYYAGFVQDDFKITHNLLLNLGLRYSIDKPRQEAHGDFSNFSPTLPNPGAGGIPGSLYFAGTGPGRIGGTGEFAKTYKKDLAPRIGFSFAPDSLHGKMAIRGGFGIYYGPLDYSDFGSANQLGFTANPQFHNNDNFSQAYCNGAPTLGSTANCNNVNGFDQSFPSYAPPPNLDPTQGNGQDLGNQLAGEYIAPGFGRPAAIYNWGLQVQQELATDLIFTLGYIGSTGTYLHSDLLQINDLNPKYFGFGSALNSPLPAGAPVPYAGFSGTLGQSLRPFPQYNNIYSGGGIENLGHSSYHALTAKLERRFHSGLNLLAAYTWSKTLTDADSTMPAFSAFDGGAGSVQNPYNLKSEKAVSFQDVPQNFVISYVYELPLGKGKKFLNHGGVVNALVGGFQVGGIDRYVSGGPTAFSCTPTSVGASLACLRYDIQPDFVNHGANANNRNPQQRQVFNPAAFTDPSTSAAFALGTSPRVNSGYRTPIYKNEDFSIIKHLANFGEYGDLQLHVDLFNAFNRVHFSGLNTNPNDLPNPATGDISNHFGSYTGSFGDPTIRQFILRYSF